MEKFKNDQNIAYKIIKNSIKNNKISHAYIIETNNNEDYFEFVQSMVIEILKNNTNNQTLKSQVLENSYPDLKIISTVNLQYKKDDIKNLIIEFKTKPVCGKYKIYIIKDANKLNNLTANALLKFIEEPEEGIIAILLVENKYQLLKTIISRCQIISLKQNKKENSDIYNFLGYDKENYYDELNNILSFIVAIEKNKKNAILYENKYIFDTFKSREDVKKVFEIMKYFYIDTLKFKNNSDIQFFKQNEDIITKIVSINSNNQLINKVNFIIENEKKLYYNVNINLLMDKLIIDLGGC